MTSQEIKNALSLGSIFAFRMLGLFMILPIFSIYAQQLPHSSPTLIGLALGSYGLTQAIFQLPFGIWSDYTSRRKVIFFGLIIFALGSIVAALSHNIWGIIIGRALQGAGAIGSCIIALMGDLTTESNRTKAMAIIGIMIAFSFMLAIILGPIIGHWIGVPGLFWLTAGLAIIAMLILFNNIPAATKQHQEFELKLLPEQIITVLRNRYIQKINLSILISHAILTALFIVLPTILVNDFKLPLEKQWHLYLPVLLVTFAIIGGILRRFQGSAHQERRLWLMCIFLILVSQFIFSEHQEETSLLFFGFNLFIFFLGFTFLETLLPALLSKAVDINYRGTASGLYSTCQFLGIFLGGVFGGYLTQHYHEVGLFYGNCVMALLWFTIVLPLWQKR